MTRQDMITNSLSALVVVVGALASQLPGISFFTEYAPPSFGMLALVTTGLTLAVFAWVFVSPTREPKSAKRSGILASLLDGPTAEIRLVKRGAVGIGTAVLLAL